MAKKSKAARVPSKNPAASKNSAAKKSEVAPVSSAPVVPPRAPLDETTFWRVALALLIVGIALRQFRLADFPYHPDEAIHAWFSTRLLNEGNYTYDPIYHGPFMYFLTSAIFAIKWWGINDYTARLVPSFLGIASLALVLGPARQWLGRRGTLWSLALLTFCAVITTYQRRLLHDSLVIFLTLMAVFCFQSALQHPAWSSRGRWSRIGLAAAVSLFIATKANAFFIIAMLGAFWIFTLLQSWWKKQFAAFLLEKSVSPKVLSSVPAALFLIISIASYFALRDPLVKEANEKMLKVVSVLCVVALGFWTIAVPPALNKREEENQLADEDVPVIENEYAKNFPASTLMQRTIITYALSLVVALFLFAFMYGHGFAWWKAPVQWFSPAQPPLPRGEDWKAIVSALPKMLEYWGGQQNTPRLPGRHDYYLPLMTLYELPLMLAAIGGIWHTARHRSAFTDLILWWSFTSFALYALANEKVPWLLAHIMLPLCFLGGVWLASLRPATTLTRVSLAVACVLAVIFQVRNISATNWERAADNHEPMFYAQTTEVFRDTLLDSLQKTSEDPGAIWTEQQWPAAWHLREGAPWVNGAPIGYGPMPGPTNRMAIASPEAFDKHAAQFAGWDKKKVDFYIWPRPSWPALCPDILLRWWWTRETQPGGKIENGILAPPGEWSNNHAIIATP